MPKPAVMSDIETGSGNVYADLGSADASGMQVKASLAAAIGDIIRDRRLTQTEAARVLGMTQPKVSALLRGQFRGISEVRMLECLNRLGRDIEIVVRASSRARRSAGQTRVVFA